MKRLNLWAPRTLAQIAGLALAMALVGSAAFAQDGPMPPAPVQPSKTTADKPAGPQGDAGAVPLPAPIPLTGTSGALPTSPADPNAPKIMVPSGTHIPLVLHNAISTRSAKPGDPVYFETLYPVMIDGKVVIPAGSYVSGEVTESKRPGRVKGRGELRLRLTSMILPNGYTVSFTAMPNNAGTGGNESVDKEGTIKGDSNKAGDAGTIIGDTGVGTAIGGIAGRSGAGAGIGAGAGLAAGLITVLLTRGPELELPRGTTLDVVLDRDLHLDPSKINFTDLGKASTLPGPPNREPQRSTSPF